MRRQFQVRPKEKITLYKAAQTALGRLRIYDGEKAVMLSGTVEIRISGYCA